MKFWGNNHSIHLCFWSSFLLICLELTFTKFATSLNRIFGMREVSDLKLWQNKKPKLKPKLMNYIQQNESFWLPLIILELCFHYHFTYLAEYRRYSLRGISGSSKYLPVLQRGLEYTLIIWYDKVKPSRSHCADIALCQSEKKGKGRANAMQSCLEHKTIQITFLNANYVGNL